MEAAHSREVLTLRPISWSKNQKKRVTITKPSHHSSRIGNLVTLNLEISALSFTGTGSWQTSAEENECRCFTLHDGMTSCSRKKSLLRSLGLVLISVLILCRGDKSCRNRPIVKSDRLWNCLESTPSVRQKLNEPRSQMTRTGCVQLQSLIQSRIRQKRIRQKRRGRTQRITTGGSCHRYHFCRDKSFVATNTSFVATKVCLSRQKYACRDKRFATKMILMAAPADDRE